MTHCLTLYIHVAYVLKTLSEHRNECFEYSAGSGSIMESQDSAGMSLETPCDGHYASEFCAEEFMEHDRVRRDPSLGWFACSVFLGDRKTFY